MSVIAQAIDLTKIYRTPASEIAVFESLNLVLTKGKLVAVIGPSGAGKSTLLHLLGGLDTPTRGTVLFKGQNVFEMSTTELARFRNRHVGFVFQFHHLLPEFTAVENTMMPKLIRGDEKSATALEAKRPQVTKQCRAATPPRPRPPASLPTRFSEPATTPGRGSKRA